MDKGFWPTCIYCKNCLRDGAWKKKCSLHVVELPSDEAYMTCSFFEASDMNHKNDESILKIKKSINDDEFLFTFMPYYLESPKKHMEFSKMKKINL